MFKSRLARWGLRRNNSKNDWKALGALYLQRKRSGQPCTIFKVRGRRRSIADLQKYVLALGMSVDEFLAEAEGHPIPEYIQLATPEVEIQPDGHRSKVGDYATQMLFEAPQYPVGAILQAQDYAGNESLARWSQSPPLRQPQSIWPLDSAEVNQFGQSIARTESGPIWHQPPPLEQPQSIWPPESAEADQLGQPITQMESVIIWHQSPPLGQSPSLWSSDNANANQLSQSTMEVGRGTSWYNQWEHHNPTEAQDSITECSSSL